VRVRKSPAVGYEFTPTPRAAIRAVSEGRLDASDYVILAAIYDRDVPRDLHVRFTLDQLADWVAWSYSADALSKRLRRLRDDGWFSYEQPRRKPYRYQVTLIPEPAPSERGPRSDPASHGAESPTGEAARPNTTPSGPSSETAESNASTTSETSGRANVVRPVQRVQRTPSSLEGKVGPEGSVGAARAREATGPPGDSGTAVIVAGRSKLPEREQAILDEISDVFGDAREIVGPLPPGRVLERVEGQGIAVELVAVDDEEFGAAKARGQYDVKSEES
jgi:hypothetical protein